jgi:ABC-type branched-subunit amino acid transport system substrate-binding protein
VIRTTEGPWGAGSKESVSLVYEDDVRAIVGALDGRNGHLAEQVAAKSHLAYVESFATEPTLSQAFVPWFMRVVPNDDQQSEILLDLIGRNGGGKTAILSAEDYDTRYAVRSLTKAVTAKTGSAPLVLPLSSDTPSERIAEKIQNSRIEHLVIPFDSPLLQDLLIHLRQAMPRLKVYGTLHLAMGIENRKTPWSQYDGIYLIAPDLLNSGTENMHCNIRSAYTYDAVKMVIQSIRQGGTDRESITKTLSAMEYEGLTGPIAFDPLGNRTSRPLVFRIENGRPNQLTNP